MWPLENRKVLLAKGVADFTELAQRILRSATNTMMESWSIVELLQADLWRPLLMLLPKEKLGWVDAAHLWNWRKPPRQRI